MLITKFNKLIGSRLLWSFFAIVICTTFVFSFALTGSFGKDSSSVGKILGTKITAAEFGVNRYLERTGKSSYEDLDAEAVDSNAWKRTAMIVISSKLGIHCSANEMMEMKVNDPYFQENGVFSEQKYIEVVQSVWNISPDVADVFLTHYIDAQRFSDVARNMTWVPPQEILPEISARIDTFEAEYVMITNRPAISTFSVTEQEAKAFFDADPESFRLPEKIDVKYIPIALSNYSAKVAVSQDDISAYYDDNLQDYSFRDTNDVLQTIPMIDVATNISNIIIRTKSVETAKDVANEIIMALTPDRNNKCITAEEAATKFNAPLKSTGMFTDLDYFKDIESWDKFSATAFKLETNDVMLKVCDDPVVGSNFLYVLIADKKEPSRIPEFSEAKEKVVSKVQMKKAEKEFRNTSGALVKTLTAKVASGMDFGKAAAESRLHVVKAPKFSVMSESTNENSTLSYEFLQTAIMMDKGEISEAVETEDGFMIVHVTDRIPGDSVSAEMLKPRISAMVSKQRAPAIVNDWIKIILKHSEINLDKAKKKERNSAPVSPINDLL